MGCLFADISLVSLRFAVFLALIFSCSVTHAVQDESIRTFRGHKSGSIHILEVSKDGSIILSSSFNEIIQWDLNSGKRLNVPIRYTHNNAIRDVTFSPDNRYIASTGDDGFIKIWDARTGQEISSFRNSAQVWTVKFSPDGKYIASGGNEGIFLWNLNTKDKLQITSVRTDALAFSPDGQRIISTGYGDKFFNIYNSISGNFISKFELSDKVIEDIEFFSDGRRILAAGGPDRSGKQWTIKIWDINTGKSTLSLPGWGYALSPDEIHIIVESYDHAQELKLWNLQTGKHLHTFLGHTDHINLGLAFTPNGKYALSSSQDKTIKLWDLSPYISTQEAGRLLSVEFAWGDTPEQFGLQQGEEIETLGAHTFSEDAQGNKYIADPVNKRIKILDSQGRYQRNIPIDTFPQDILLNQRDILILDENGLTWQNRRYPLSPEVPVLEGYGQGLWQDYENSVYVCKAQECYKIIDNSSGRQRVLSPQEQFDSVMPGYPLKDVNWLRTEWLNPKQARIVIFTPDEVVKEIPLETTDSFGAVSFIGQSAQGWLFFEIERITADQSVYLVLWTYDTDGNLLAKKEFSNDYYSTVYKKLSLDVATGRIRQMYTTAQGVKYEVWEPPINNNTAPPPPPANAFALFGTVTDEHGRPLSGAKIKLPLVGGDREMLTGPDGGYRLIVDKTQLPRSFIVLASARGFLPESQNITLDTKRYDSYRHDLRLTTAPKNVVMLEIEPKVHHLGDDHYGGAVNSKFQNKTEGKSFKIDFYLDSSHLAYDSAALSLVVKGIDRSGADRIILNSSAEGKLPSSPRDGSFGKLFITIPKDTLVIGKNTIEIISHCGRSDCDDFEFTNMMVEFK